MITIRINLPRGTPKATKRMAEGMKPALVRGVNRAANRLNNEIKRQLSLAGGVSRKGKNPTAHLRVQSGALRSSWVARPAQDVAGTVEAHVTTSTPYAAIHEFGGAIMHHARSFLRGFNFVRPTKRSKRRRVFSGALSQGATRSSWTVRIPKRPYVNPAVTKERPGMTEDIRGEVMALTK